MMLRMLLVLKNSDADVDLAAASEFLKDNSLKQAIHPISNQPTTYSLLGNRLSSRGTFLQKRAEEENVVLEVEHT